MDEREVERVARLIHDTFSSLHLARHPKARPTTFEELPPANREDHLGVARAVLADQYAPTAVVTG